MNGTPTCTRCRQPATPDARYCMTCGHELLMAGKSAPAPMPPAEPVTEFSNGLVNASRLLAALCMLSAILAVTIYDFQTSMGRTLTLASVGVSMFGQVFVTQATKPNPPRWTSNVLMLFWVGLVALVVLWALARR